MEGMSQTAVRSTSSPEVDRKCVWTKIRCQEKRRVLGDSRAEQTMADKMYYSGMLSQLPTGTLAHSDQHRLHTGRHRNTGHPCTGATWR